MSTQALNERRGRVYTDLRGNVRWFQRWIEAWWVLTGQWTLHRAWQNGYDDHAVDEAARRMRGGQ